MMINYYEKVKQFIEKNPQLAMSTHATISATDEMVARIEEELGLKLRGEYLQFIRTWGTISLAGCVNDYFAIYRWGGRVIDWVIDEAKYLWNSKGLPHNYIPIVSMNGEDWYCLDPSIDGNQAVYFFDCFAGLNELSRKESDSLFELIWRDIEENGIPNSLKDGDQVNL